VCVCARTVEVNGRISESVHSICHRNCQKLIYLEISRHSSGLRPGAELSLLFQGRRDPKSTLKNEAIDSCGILEIICLNYMAETPRRPNLMCSRGSSFDTLTMLHP
jgi:hypothetical protein